MITTFGARLRTFASIESSASHYNGLGHPLLLAWSCHREGPIKRWPCLIVSQDLFSQHGEHRGSVSEYGHLVLLGHGIHLHLPGRQNLKERPLQVFLRRRKLRSSLNGCMKARTELRGLVFTTGSRKRPSRTLGVLCLNTCCTKRSQ